MEPRRLKQMALSTAIGLAGIVLIAVHGNWLLALGVFLVFAASMIEQTT